MSGAANKLVSYLEGCRDRAGSMLAELVRIPTVNPYSGDADPSGEAAGQEFAAERMKQLGAETRFIAVPVDVYSRAGIIGPRDRDWANRPCVVGRFVFGSGGTKVVLNAHMDTIGVTGYQGEPFAGSIDDGVVQGRGASDCKSGIVAGLLAVEALQQSGVDLDCEILFESVIDEECNGGGAGTLACCYDGVLGDYCLVLDGYSGAIYPSCQGICTADISVVGRAGHGCLGGVSAIEKLLVVKSVIDRLAAERAKTHPEARANIGVLRAGTAPWTVADTGFLSVNINYTYGEAVESERSRKGFGGAILREQLEGLITQACEADEWLREHLPEIIWMKDVPPFRIADCGDEAGCERLLTVAQDSYRQAWGVDADVAELAAWGDASHLARVGKMPTVGMGAGKLGTAHTSVEHNAVENVIKTAMATALTVLKL